MAGIFFFFYITTGFTLAIRLDGRSKDVKYLDYFGDGCHIFPDRLCSVGNQVFLLQSVIRVLENLMKVKIIPSGVRWGCVSLKCLVFYGKYIEIGF